MNKLDAFKAITGLIVGSGVNKIAKAIVDAHIAPETTFEKVLVGAGRIGVSMTAAAIVVRNVDSQIDEYANSYRTITEKVQTKLDQK